jgi:hypothetical protein
MPSKRNGVRVMTNRKVHTISPKQSRKLSTKTKIPPSLLDDIAFETREKIDIARVNRFKCGDRCCLTESAQYKIMFAEAMGRKHDKN